MSGSYPPNDGRGQHPGDWHSGHSGDRSSSDRQGVDDGKRYFDGSDQGRNDYYHDRNNGRSYEYQQGSGGRGHNGGTSHDYAYQDGRSNGGNSYRSNNEQRGGGGVDLQQYTRNDNRTDSGWETVQNNRQSRRDGSWHQSDQQQQQQHRQQQPPPFMLMLVGIPGSGKSTFAKSLESAAPQYYVRINQDTLGNRKKCQAATRRALSNNKCPIVDRCNFDPSQRRYFLDIAREYNVPVDCISLELPKEECVRRCQDRSHHETIRSGEERQVVNKMMAMFQAPHASEGFSRVERVSRVNQVNALIAEYSSNNVAS